MPHKLRKTRKQRGSRFYGYGRVGQHRESGTKGHRKVGRHKHGWSYVIKYEPDYFGKRGFTPPRSVGPRVKTINVSELEELATRMATEEKVEKKKGKVFLDLEKLGYDKLLGMGNITKPLTIKVASYSKGAAQKIEEAGGQILKEDKGESAQAKD